MSRKFLLICFVFVRFVGIVYNKVVRFRNGGVAEWFKAHDWKSCLLSGNGVQIPLL